MKVAILGTVPASKFIAPFDDPEWEIWVCSAGNKDAGLKRISRWFELHSVGDLKGSENDAWRAPFFAWLAKQTFPVYMLEPNDLLPQAAFFPGLDLNAKWGDRARLNLTSSIAWMILYAMDIKATEIAIFGVDMAADEEAYSQQKSGCLNLLQWAAELGIKVSIPNESCLGTPPPLYGYAEGTPMGRRLLLRELQCRQEVANLDATIARLIEERAMFRGSLNSLQYVRRTFVDGADAMLDLPASGAETVPVRVLASGVLVPSAAVSLTPAENGPAVGEILTDGAYSNGSDPSPPSPQTSASGQRRRRKGEVRDAA